jgi:hypothetical protein
MISWKEGETKISYKRRVLGTHDQRVLAFVDVWLKGQEKVKQYLDQVRMAFGVQIRLQSPEKGHCKFDQGMLAFGCACSVVHPSEELKTR